MVQITVLVDNQALRGLRAAWGLSIMVESEQRVLFDTGPSGDVLEYNASALGKSLSVDCLVITHQHWDHVGGVDAVNFKRAIVPEDGPVRGEIHTKPVRLGTVETTGVLFKPIAEQGLIVYGSKNALLVGCSHPGVDALLLKAVEVAGHIDIVMGGFHLLNASKERVREIARVFRENADEVYPMHCTGARAKEILKEELGDVVKDGFAGLKVQL